MSIENRSLKLPHSSGVLCGQKRSIFGEGIVKTYLLLKDAAKSLVIFSQASGNASASER